MSRIALVADRRELLGGPHDDFAGSRMELEAPVETGSGEDAFIQSHLIVRANKLFFKFLIALGRWTSHMKWSEKRFIERYSRLLGQWIIHF